LRLLKFIFKEVEALMKISIIFEDFFREIDAFSRIARIFKYIFKGIMTF
jgi:hypothetical protein